MAVDQAGLKPGDVMVMSAAATPTDDSVSWLIQGGAAMKTNPWKPGKWVLRASDDVYYNHVAMYTHTDTAGHYRGLEGRPSSFGWANLDASVADQRTVANTGQPKTEQQRTDLVAAATRMVGTPYDWR